MDKTQQITSKEWVGAPVAQPPCERRKGCAGETFTPSARVLRSCSRTKLDEVQASDAKLITECAIGSVRRSARIEANKKVNSNSQTHIGPKTNRKMSLSTQPDKHHRNDSNVYSDHLPPSLDGGLSDKSNAAFCHITHPTRVSNSSAIDKKMETRINFPASSNNIWCKIDEELKIIIPQIFTKRQFNQLSTSELSQKFDSWLHNFFLERFGKKESKVITQSKRQQRPNKALNNLRRRKKQCKAARKALIKAGLKGSTEEEIITREWFSLVRQHNKLRVALKKKQYSREQIQEERSFRSDPHKFASNIFNKQQKSAAPTFSAEEAYSYFKQIYRDSNRDHIYIPLPELVRPELPLQLFSLRCPTENELKRSVQRKRNGAAPGLNALTYVPYKKCASIMKFVHKLGIKIWKSKDIPTDWAMAYVVLLSKSNDLSLVSEFRPIAITCVCGKIFFSVLSERLQVFMLRNNYISRDIQKGFLSGMPGCIEHTFGLLEALRDAKESYRQIVLCWLDLANAYGSVRHNLIQFALNWYHVPKDIQALIFDYYEKLCAMISTNNWSTGFFLWDIGLFQGCVLSTILFDCVFQLLLDFLRPISKLGYEFKSTPTVSTSKKAYADDLTLITRNAVDMQTAVDLTTRWLKWTETMKAKPSKCISLGFKLFDKKIKNEKFIPLTNSVYSPFDPKIVIDEQVMNFIVNPADKDPFKGNHFKFLGRWINPLLKEKDIKDKIVASLSHDIEIVKKSKVNGFMKLWLYQFYVLSHLSWPFLINDLDLSFAQDLQRNINRTLKRWAGVGKSVDNGLMFRSKKNFGLGLTSISDHYQRMQLIKCQLLQNSKDTSIRQLYKTREQLNSKLSRVWRATKLSKTANAEVDLNLKFPSQQGQKGLGYGNFNPTPSLSERRELVKAKANTFLEESYLVHSVSLKQQSVWMQWSESTFPFDFSWQNLIWGGISTEVFKFVLAASVNWVRTPDLLQLWGYKKNSYCCLCGASKCTLHHILSACIFSLEQKRFTWRHDSILSVINQTLQEHVQTTNQNQQVSKAPTLINFVKAGQQSTKTKRSNQLNLLSNANDWKLLIDLPDCNYVFPPEIYTTAERPDIVIWSTRTKRVILIELTCPAEEGIEAAQIRKQARYAHLMENIANNSSWKPSLFTVEVGARGFIATSTQQVFLKLGMKLRTISTLLKRLSSIVAKCSYTIFLAANSKSWDVNRPLLDT